MIEISSKAAAPQSNASTVATRTNASIATSDSVTNASTDHGRPNSENSNVDVLVNSKFYTYRKSNKR